MEKNGKILSLAIARDPQAKIPKLFPPARHILELPLPTIQKIQR
jgi:hypothetical protein